jgi:hypothetical protein
MLIPLVPWFGVIMDFKIAAPGDDDSPESSTPRGRVIEFYVPATFQLPARRWLPPEERGKVIEFPGRGIKKSA